MKQGGGVTRHAGVSTYVDLIVRDLSAIEHRFPQTAALFRDFAAHTQGSSNFGYAELDKDNRLHESLCITKSGRTFYKKLIVLAPLITVSNTILGDAKNCKNVVLFALTEMEQDPLATLNAIHDVFCKNTVIIASDLDAFQSDKDDFLDGIERLNKILCIKPGFLGISINVNQIIDDWIKKKKLENAPRSPRYGGRLL